MSTATTMPDMLNAAGTVSSISGISMLCANGSGEFVKLASSTMMAHRGQVSDCNDAKTFGCWLASGESVLNAPIATPNSSDRIIFLGSNSVYGVQAYIPLHVQQGIFFRKLTNNSWSGWYSVSLTART